MAGWWLRRRSAARLAELDALRAPLLAATEAEGGEGANVHPSFGGADTPVPSGRYSVTAPGAEAPIFARLGGFVAVAGSVAEARQAGGWAGCWAGVCSALSLHEPGARQM